MVSFIILMAACVVSAYISSVWSTKRGYNYGLRFGATETLRQLQEQDAIKPGNHQINLRQR